MKKVIVSIIFSILMLCLVGCQVKTEDNISKIILIEDEDNLSVEIIATNDTNSYKGMPITFKPKVIGQYDKELQYHWILNTDNDFEGFSVLEKGPQKEIINSGEEVELGLFAEVDYIDETLIEFKVKLQVEDKETSDIIATDEITIKNTQGTYSIKQ